MVDYSIGASVEETGETFRFTIKRQYVNAAFTAIRQRQAARVERPASRCEILQDLMADSLEPLTQHFDPEKNEAEVDAQAVAFMSAFKVLDLAGRPVQTPLKPKWKLDLSSVPSKFRQAIRGQPNTHNTSSYVGYRFTRFRFPSIRFDWQVETPNFVIRNFPPGENTVEMRWTAWGRASVWSNSNLAAYGRIKDTIYIDQDPQQPFLIKEREFTVENILQPELMRPNPLLRIESPDQGEPDIFTLLSTRGGILQGIRSSQKHIAFLIALSALLNAFKPLVDNKSHVGGWVFTAVAILTALISVISMLLGWLLIKMEARAAQNIIATA